MSGRKNTLVPIPVITNGDMSGSLTSLSTNIQYLDFWSFEFVATGSADGQYDIQVSHDNLNWVTLNLPVTAAIIAGSPNPVIIANTEVVPEPYVRAIYTATSGTGTLNVTLTARQG